VCVDVDLKVLDDDALPARRGAPAAISARRMTARTRATTSRGENGLVM